MPPAKSKSKSKSKTSSRSKGSPFSPEIFGFLVELGLNNEREWFNANKQRYEDAVREPALEFIRQMGPHLAKVSKHFTALDKKVGGSLMRVHRDVRFSKNKDPYKTNVGIQFRHEAGKDVHAPGFYLHIEPGEIFIGIGMWHPEASALKAVREAIVDSPAKWKRARDDAKFKKHFELRGESLKRPPRGFDAEHPYIEDLKRKDHIAVCEIGAKEITKPGFVKLVAERFAAAKPYVKFLGGALDLPV